ncbi:hypothetical protein C7T35_09790 [Variovorax sp. WS11]|uniref:hypothetical protein n=1 Tax=Variovorax sp. WS11 TaxID=1105204 RepID=UPI000D0C9963|nr:hypothetical protein [Variovorax sp. WS11]NDZ15517.1 hypothetical protein [Variovorax sp. WS11]PSL84868.1 hypothetical protein C7T35_09790 [Variovorax sp. WS11]
MSARFRIEALAPAHDRAEFACRYEALDKYLREQASQDVRRRTSACYVAIDTQSGAIAGYYTLAAGSVPLTDLSETMTKKLPRFPLVPLHITQQQSIDLRPAHRDPREEELNTPNQGLRCRWLDTALG